MLGHKHTLCSDVSRLTVWDAAFCCASSSCPFPLGVKACLHICRRSLFVIGVPLLWTIAPVSFKQDGVFCLSIFGGLNAASPTPPLRNSVKWFGKIHKRMVLSNLWHLHPYSSRRRLHRSMRACATGYPPVGVRLSKRKCISDAPEGQKSAWQDLKLYERLESHS